MYSIVGKIGYIVGKLRKNMQIESCIFPDMMSK